MRAVAVVPVILFHAGFSVMGGGYVGVDVFFVISGFLITTLLIEDLERGDFSVLRFYERRARRILPALFTVILVSLPLAYMWMFPSQLKAFAKSIIAVMVFASNVLFWREDGYFAASAELKPLLHTWSLAVEEQFYLLFPLALFVMWKFGRRKTTWAIIAAALASFCLAEWAQNEPRISSAASFYLTPTRAWELLAGSICAALTVGRAQRSNDIAAGFGLTLIVVSIFLFDENTPFPSHYTLAPVLGAALIILFAAKNTWTARLLSWSPFVGIGLISYSAYLWHQPLFAFARLRSPVDPSLALMGVLSGASLVLAYATWRWIEQPWRRRDQTAGVTGRTVFVASGLGGMFFVAVSAIALAGDGMPSRFSQQVLAVLDGELDRADMACLMGQEDPIPVHPKKGCLHVESGTSADVMVLGDSHSHAISGALVAALVQEGIGVYDVNHNGCVPLMGFLVLSQDDPQKCAKFVESAFDYATETGIETVVLTGRWALFLHGTRFDNHEGGHEAGGLIEVDVVSDDKGTLKDRQDRQDRLLRASEAQILTLSKSFNVVLVYPIPEAGWNVPNQAAKRLAFQGDASPLTTSNDVYAARNMPIIELFDRLTAQHPRIFAARIQEDLCDPATRRCLNSGPDGPYYYDDDHMSNLGAGLISPTIVTQVKAAQADTAR